MKNFIGSSFYSSSNAKSGLNYFPRSRLKPLLQFPTIISDFAFGCTHNCFMHLKVALSLSLIVVMELFFNRSVKISHLAALKNRED